MISTPRECAAVRADGSEFALGILTGRERSQVVDHMATCAACRKELESLSSLVDGLVALAPQVQPPLGFETRVVAHFRSPSPRRARHLRYRSMVATAVVAVVALGTVVVSGTHSPEQPSASAYHDEAFGAALTLHGRDVGHVWFSPGNPAWIYMSLNDAPETRRVTCQVTLSSGRVLTEGTFVVRGGFGAWAAPLGAPVASVASVRVIDATGHAVASAQISS